MHKLLLSCLGLALLSATAAPALAANRQQSALGYAKKNKLTVRVVQTKAGHFEASFDHPGTYHVEAGKKTFDHGTEEGDKPAPVYGKGKTVRAAINAMARDAQKIAREHGPMKMVILEPSNVPIAYMRPGLEYGKSRTVAFSIRQLRANEKLDHAVVDLRKEEHTASGIYEPTVDAATRKRLLQ
jgi:hypothetical protein